MKSKTMIDAVYAENQKLNGFLVNFLGGKSVKKKRKKIDRTPDAEQIAERDACMLKLAWRDMPSCVDTDPLVMKTIADLRSACLIQLDLINEGQDGTENDDVVAIYRWLAKYKG